MSQAVLRPFQDAAIDCVRDHIREGRRRVLLVSPTGGGKMVCAAYMIQSARKFGGRALFVAHRKELLDQAVMQLGRWGVTEVGVIRADDKRTNELMPVQVASISTLARRQPPPADLIIIDESHRALANQYQALLEYYEGKNVIGLTATAARLDNKPMRDIFQALVVAGRYSDLIKLKYIVAPRMFEAEKVVDLTGVHTRMGEWVQDELEEKMAKVYGDVVREWKDRAGGRQTVLFAVSIAHSMDLAERFRVAGVAAEHVDGSTPDSEREAIFARLATGETRVVCNVDICSEGFDLPPVKCLIDCGPTKSLTRFMQRAGRLLRPWNMNTPPTRSWQESDGPSEVPIILDHTGNIQRHGFPHEDREWSLDAEPKKPPKPTRCIKCRAMIRFYPCDACGFAPPAPPPPERSKPLEAPSAMREIAGEDPRRFFFMSQVELARARGFKPGFAGAKYKEKYGGWPPWSWSEEIKQQFANDDGWQRRQAVRSAERQAWASRDVKDEPDTPETFSSWASEGDPDIPF